MAVQEIRPENEAGSSVHTTSPTEASSRPQPDSARPGTTDTYDGPLQEFYPEGGDFEDEDYDDGESVTGVFAFTRPTTGAAPHIVPYDYATEAGTHKVAESPTSKTDDARLTVRPVLGYGQTQIPLTISHTSSRDTGAASLAPVDEPGLVDVGGHLPHVVFDSANPPPFSGPDNLNNSVFTHASKRRRSSTANSTQFTQHPHHPSLFQRLQRRRLDSGNLPTASRRALTSVHQSPESRVTVADSHTTRPSDGPTSIRPNSVSSSLDGIASVSAFASDGVTASGRSKHSGRTGRRDSFGLTELTGDPTVPGGQTVWGDGEGGLVNRSGDFVPEFDAADEDSPYAEVRASVSNLDDPDMPALTIRSWIIGLVLVGVASAANTFFSFRNPAPFISSYVLLVLAYPLGKLAALVMPYKVIKLPKWLGGWELDLNPGPFNIKEHSVIIIMANVGVNPAYALNATVATEIWYNHKFGVGFDILFIFSTQITGFAFAGLCRKFVIHPASMIWPSVIAVATNLNTLHAEDDVLEKGMNRSRLLKLVIGGAFAWHFLPGFLFTALSVFSWACWIAPNNRTVNTLFGVNQGLGFGILTFDWTQITWTGMPLAVPWWASMNIGLGFVLFFWILAPIAYYCNVWESAYLPISWSAAFDRFGQEYNVTAVLGSDLSFNQTAYAEYSPVYLSATFNVTYILLFAVSTSALVHTALYHGRRIYKTVTRVAAEPSDIHMKLMSHYPEVPDWWYLCLFAVCFIFSIVAIKVWHTGLPVWAYFVSLLLPAVYFLPAAFIFAMTSQQIAINLLAEILPGYFLPGRPIPGMIFKTFSIQTLVEGLAFIQSQKLGHYMKVPPRATFIAQSSATAICCLLQVGTKALLFHIVPDMCADGQASSLTCPNAQVFFSASVIWGVIGPRRLFSPGRLFNTELWALLAGLVAPIPLWLWVRKRPGSRLRNLSLPLILNGGTWIPPATGINYTSYMVVAFVFQYWIRRRHFGWWAKYNYVLAAAMEVGTTVSVIFIFLTLGLTNSYVSWWGNTVYQNTLDYQVTGVAHLDIPANGFGPDTW